MAQRTLSEETKRLLEELDQPASSITRLVRLSDSSAGVVDRIGASGEAAAIPYVLPYVFDKRRSVARAAARAAASLLSGVPVSELPWLDARLRERSTWWPGWFGMKSADLRALAQFEDSQPALLRLATCHPSGYVREASLKALESAFDGAELPFLLIRLNDWVVPVRRCAQELVRRRTTPDYARHLVRSLPLVIRLGDLGRADHSEAVEMILSMLRQPVSREALLEGTRSADRKIRRLAYRLGAECSGPAAGDLVRAALEDEDQLVRLWAARRVAGLFGPDRLPEILDSLERDPFMAVRQHALDVRLEHLPDTAEPKLLEFLLDRAAGVRGHCQYYLKKRFQRDSATEYREHLAGDPDRLRECILGLGEVGEAADVNGIESYLDDPRSRIRTAAIRSVARLSKDPPVEKFLQALQEPSGGVSREAREALERCASKVSPDDLEAIYRGAQERHVRKNALLVVTRLGLWDSLPILVNATCDRDERLRELGRGFVSRWLIRSNRVQVVPNRGQVQRARESLDSCSNRMDAAQWAELDFVLRTAVPR